MKRFLLLAVAAVLVATGLQAQAQRIGCVRVDEGTRASEYHVLSDPFEFAPNTTYRQPVVLISFSDTDFSMTPRPTMTVFSMSRVSTRA